MGGVISSVLILLLSLYLPLSLFSCKSDDDNDSPTYYTITISSTIANGSVEASKKSAASGATITLTLSAAEGYEFESLSVTTSGGTSLTTTAVTAGTSYTFTMPESNVTVSATFKATAVTPQKTAGSISYATTTISKTTADEAFTNELINTGDGTVSYASSKETVATVNATTGLVTIKGAGETTITATVADSDTYTYATKTASYTLTVTQTYTVTLTGGANATVSGGATTQSDLSGAMTTVTYTASDGYYFADFTATTTNGITLTRTSSSVVTVSGTPTTDTSITVPDAAQIITLNITNPSVGQVIGSDGENYAADEILPADVTAVAKICYVSGSNGLALALADEGDMNWSTAIETCAAHKPVFTGGTWKLASKDEWSSMISAAGSYSALRDGFSSVGGTNMQSGYYWSSTESGSDSACDCDFDDGDWSSDAKYLGTYVRACLAFEVSGSATTRTLAEATTDDIGKIAGADGNIYDTKAAAEAVATGNAVAMIAYVGTASDCAHGLAIALADESGMKNYEAAGTACSGKAAVTGGTWRLPSEKDWQYMFIGCGSSESYSAPTYDPFMSKSYSGLASKLTTAQGAAFQSDDLYWSSTEDNSNGVWGVVFNGSNATFYMEGKTEEHQVRACLAF